MPGSASKPISLGVIGAGVAATIAHIPAALKSEDFDLVAILDRDRSQLERFNKAEIPHLCGRSEEFFAVRGMDAVIVATPDGTHSQFVAEALRHELDVLVEKPMGRSVDECEVLVALATTQGRVLAVGHEKRFHPTLARVGAILADGVIGEPFLCGVHWASRGETQTRSSSRKGSSVAIGGAGRTRVPGVAFCKTICRTTSIFCATGPDSNRPPFTPSSKTLARTGLVGPPNLQYGKISLSLWCASTAVLPSVSRRAW